MEKLLRNVTEIIVNDRFDKEITTSINIVEYFLVVPLNETIPQIDLVFIDTGTIEVNIHQYIISLMIWKRVSHICGSEMITPDTIFPDPLKLDNVNGVRDELTKIVDKFLVNPMQDVDCKFELYKIIRDLAHDVASYEANILYPHFTKDTDIPRLIQKPMLSNWKDGRVDALKQGKSM